MISQHERYGFLGEFRVKTYRNLFKNDVPLGFDLFKKLQQLHLDGKAHLLNRNLKALRIKEFNITNSRHAEVLFHMTDPNIPDNVLSDRTNGTLRTITRGKTEDPAVSAHVVVSLDAKYDQSRTYPACVENIDYLPRSLVIDYFNEWWRTTFQSRAEQSRAEQSRAEQSRAEQSRAEQRRRVGEDKDKLFQPRVEFIAPASHTIKGALEAGGVLKGVKWVEDKVVEAAFGDKAYPVEKRTDVGLKVKNRPTGDAAKQILIDLFGQANMQAAKSTKVTIEDGNDRTKTIGIDPSKNNVLSNIFIPQARFDNFSPPMAMCEESLRGDLIAKMKATLKI
ncbi:hypothetical protein O4G76_06770 [Limimaricola sp. G21655-S1]|uniref:hypothetical protein n=1 Tax=Limimaricola sp. G21655-S1 TaxID=3014768 RepID=UPI0022AF3B95|nr:hypothetical protein [Limimaricola sp. G21655-S1]MCZ4260544.1 hypothetical protein [Limimaricola sp. G21655-S1]